MPIYKYQCKKCAHEWESFFTSFSEAEREEPETKCPQCESPEKEKVIGGTSFQLKGKGWAKDRYD
jgi:putative FmdB family regulatory protein